MCRGLGKLYTAAASVLVLMLGVATSLPCVWPYLLMDPSPAAAVGVETSAPFYTVTAASMTMRLPIDDPDKQEDDTSHALIGEASMRNII